jgi:microsomal dipeptidase-like Zn-dependent dipeptidase
MSYFDFHIHPTLKCMFSEGNAKTNPYIPIDTRSINWFIRWCSEFEYILNSQANLQQLIQNKVNLACVAIFTPDPALTKDNFILTQARGTLSKYLNPSRLDRMNSGALQPYPTLVHEDVFEVLLNPERFSVDNTRVVAIKGSEEYDENAVNTLHVVFSVEGCHTLSSTVDKSKIEAEDVLRNLDDLRKKGLHIISINLTHLEQFPFCNHAYGIQIVESDQFAPTGNKISNDGIKVIKHCYERNIMIDIKHMSLGARKMLTEDIRHRNDINTIVQPIVCTHAGFTSLSYDDIPDFVIAIDKNAASTKLSWAKPKKYTNLEAVAFNPSSINLYDEDILAILHSGGLIGLSLDKRILGFTSADPRSENYNELVTEEEYVSNKELSLFLHRDFGAKADDFHCITNKEVAEGGLVNPAVAYYHLQHFMAHIAHLIVVAAKFDYDVDKALSQVCIGSDFDGLINPIWSCDTIDNIRSFEESFILHFPAFVRANKHELSLPHGFNTRRFARQLFYENGRNFVLHRLDITAEKMHL